MKNMMFSVVDKKETVAWNGLNDLYRYVRQSIQEWTK